MDQSTTTGTTSPLMNDTEAVQYPGIYILMLILLAVFLTLAITDCYLFVWLYRKITGKKKNMSEEASIESSSIATEKDSESDSRHVTFSMPENGSTGGESTQNLNQQQQQPTAQV
jgi:H+/gluconate symporter-like permease